MPKRDLRGFKEKRATPTKKKKKGINVPGTEMNSRLEPERDGVNSQAENWHTCGTGIHSVYLPTTVSTIRRGKSQICALLHDQHSTVQMCLMLVLHISENTKGHWIKMSATHTKKIYWKFRKAEALAKSISLKWEAEGERYATQAKYYAHKRPIWLHEIV